MRQNEYLWCKGLTTPKKRALENILGKEKMLETSIFFLYHNVFYPIEDKKNHFRNNKLSSAFNAFKFVKTKISSFGKELN